MGVNRLGAILISFWSIASLGLQLTPVVNRGLDSPVGVGNAPGEPGRIYIVEQRGTIRILEAKGLAKVPFLDIRDRVVAGGELGLLGLAFHPNYASNGRYFVNYTTRRAGQVYTVVSELNRAGGAEKRILSFEQPYSNHNGGGLAFGPRGYLYIGVGDGGDAGDPLNAGQNPHTWLGSILRIDINGSTPYRIPPTNPFVNGGGAPEVYAYGLRNPWRFSFDPVTGALYAGDVGQNRVEEISVIRRGGNYGWRIMEGTLCFDPPANCNKTNLIPPVFEYPRTEGVSVTGGFVYRGRNIPALNGTYIFGDWGSGKIWGIRVDPKSGKSGPVQLLFRTRLRITTFGRTSSGEILVVGQTGKVFRIDP